MYWIIGSDGKQYGPVSAGQLQQWIAEGRANFETLALLEGSTEWKPLGSFPEFSLAHGTGGFPPSGVVPGKETRPMPAGKTNGFAVASLVCGVISLCCFCCCYGLPFNLAGLVFALIGLAQISNNPQLYQGKSIAVAGLVLCVLSILCSVGLLSLSGLAHGWQKVPHRTYRL